MMTKTSSKLLNLIRKSKSFLIAGHINPEGDSIGSTLALALGLKKMGKKEVVVLSKDPVPEILRFLPSAKNIKQKPPRREFDLLIIVDCNTLKRTGFEALPARTAAVIDHHVLTARDSGSAFYKSVAARLIDPRAAAAGVLVYKTLTGLKIPLDKNIATNLYTALLGDTGGFRYSNVNPESLKIASHLVEAGAVPWNIAKEVYENIPYKSMSLLGHSLATIKKKDGIAWITTTKNMLIKTGTTAEDAEDFVDFPRKVKGVEVAVFLRQDSNRQVKISLRSKGKIDVQKIAKSFGGGGHAAAAGCMVKGTLKEVQARVFRVVRKAIREYNESK
jgi:phosphoesterase RecJ-like protein